MVIAVLSSGNLDVQVEVDVQVEIWSIGQAITPMQNNGVQRRL